MRPCKQNTPSSARSTRHTPFLPEASLERNGKRYRLAIAVEMCFSWNEPSPCQVIILLAYLVLYGALSGRRRKQLNGRHLGTSTVAVVYRSAIERNESRPEKDHMNELEGDSRIPALETRHVTLLDTCNSATQDRLRVITYLQFNIVGPLDLCDHQYAYIITDKRLIID